MKANAPEKIYFDGENKACKLPIFSSQNIEYTRTDAFIEKAVDWLKTHSEADYFELIPDANYCGVGNLNEKRMIEEFIKYMKGE